MNPNFTNLPQKTEASQQAPRDGRGQAAPAPAERCKVAWQTPGKSGFAETAQWAAPEDACRIATWAHGQGKRDILIITQQKNNGRWKFLMRSRAIFPGGRQ